MPVNILFFGQLAELTGEDHLEFERADDLDGLKRDLFTKFPSLKEKKFLVAVDKTITRNNIELKDGMTIAFLPPFSGG